MNGKEVERIEIEGVGRIVQHKIAKVVSNHADLQDHTEFVEILCHACFPDVAWIIKLTVMEFVMTCLAFAVQNGQVQEEG